MERLVFILIIILTFNSSCSETICEKGNIRAINDFNAGRYFLHSEEVLPVDNTYFYVLRQYYNVNWRFTDSLEYYRCYDSTMLTFLDKKYQIDISGRAMKIADSLERTPNWKRAAEYPGGNDEIAKDIVKQLKTNGLKTNDMKRATLFIQFNVDRSGRVSDAKIIKGEVNQLVEKQILDIISSTKWTPQYQYGKPIDTTLAIPIQLDISE